MTSTSFFHTGITVSDLDEAKSFFSEVFGLTVTSERELSGDYLSHMLQYEQELTARIAMLQTGDETFIELVEYHTISGSLPRPNEKAIITNSGVPHFAFFTDNLILFHESHNLNKLSALAVEQDVIPGGPFKGGFIRFYRTSFGCLIEVIQRPVVE